MPLWALLCDIDLPLILRPAQASVGKKRNEKLRKARIDQNLGVHHVCEQNALARLDGIARRSPAKCMQDEQAAADQLAKLWPQFKQSDASRCVQITTTGGAASYVELLTCLQAAKIEDKAKDPLGPLPTIAK